jgi:uncharacterized protein YjdB
LAIPFAACGGGNPTEPPPPTTTVSIEPNDPSLSIGATVTLTATPRDAAGTVVTGRPVAWTTSRAEVATINTSTGVVTAIGAGIAIVRATIDQRFDEVFVTVNVPVSSVQVTARRTTLDLTRTLQLTATTRDGTGGLLFGRPITWSTSDPSRATVSDAGLVTAVGEGSVTITATSEGAIGTIVLLLVDVPTPEISGVSPATLTPGVTATVTGSNFETNASDLEVTIDGVPVTVMAATATQLTLQLPAFMPCRLTGSAPVSITGIGGTATRPHPLQVARQRSVAVGEMLVLSGFDVRCNELPSTAARYALAVVNASQVPGGSTSYEFRGLGPPAATASTVSGSRALTWSSVGGRAAGDLNPLRRGAILLQERDHRSWLEQERALARRLGAPRKAHRARRLRAVAERSGSGGALTQRSAAPVPLEVGATTTLKIRTMSDISCRASQNVPARVVYVGPRAVILESTDAPLAGTMDADYVALGTAYDQTMHDVLVQNFGNPVAYDATLDNNGRIIMLFTKAVNDRAANLLGFVTICDFFPSDDPDTPASNQAEIFYARVPTAAEGSPNGIASRAGWLHAMYGTLIHEAKHLVSYAERAQTPVEAELEESWLEEGTAQVAAELYGRATFYAGKATWKGNATYENTMFCDVRPTDPACGGQPSIIRDHFLFLFSYLEGIEAKSYFSPAGFDNTVYGSGWLLARWAADHHATDEAAFFRALTQSFTLTGLRNVEARLGREFASFHPEFMMSLYADDVAEFTPSASGRYTIPSWNMRNMFLGVSQDFTRGGEPIPAFPLRVRSFPFGVFNADVGASVGGAASYVELSGTPAGPQVLDLRSPGAKALPLDTPLRLVILRLQ